VRNLKITVHIFATLGASTQIETFTNETEWENRMVQEMGDIHLHRPDLSVRKDSFGPYLKKVLAMEKFDQLTSDLIPLG
jgi:hypothetical protein